MSTLTWESKSVKKNQELGEGGGFPRGNNYKIGDIHVWTVGPLVRQGTMIITRTSNESPQHILLRSSNHSNMRLLNTWRKHYWNSLMVRSPSKSTKVKQRFPDHHLKDFMHSSPTLLQSLQCWVIWLCLGVADLCLETIESVPSNHFNLHIMLSLRGKYSQLR